MNSKTKKNMVDNIVQVAKLFATQFVLVEDSIVISEHEFYAHAHLFKGDLDGLEAFINHIHLEDVVQMPRNAVNPQEQRHALLETGRLLIQVWHERIQFLYNGVVILFYLGGSDTVSVRFHKSRSIANAWINLSDQDFLNRESIEVYRSSEEGVELISAPILSFNKS